jgi:hypothetical protein
VASDLLFAEVFSATDRILWYQKGNPHRRIAETTIALDAGLHSIGKLSTGKLSIGKRALRRFPNFQRGFARRANSN